MPGFCTLVSYAEELQRMYDLPVLSVRFVGPSTDIPLSDLTPVAYGKKSLVVLRRSAFNVLKICSPSSAEMERRIHAASDGHSNVRRLVNWGMVSIGENNDVFGFLELEGYGQPLGREHIADMEAMDDMWNQAYRGLKHLHSKGVLHRDVKPDNLVVFPGNVLKINDYDVSCFKGESRAYSEMVGTVGYQSPSDMLPYAEEDDVLSLALSFYALKFGTTTTSKAGRLHILLRELQPDVFPGAMIQAVEEAVMQLNLELLEED
ncbi:serine/threonine-protein kinase chk1-like [Selaginella moellendorffii]|uniref:serine/threonine-protein kinase chk1-like n=1 Tax=Selaginella moellendorffii TaxID=88036 RepID=UPI000D1C32B9|nr:serine/threonine-protein kinase chk1-like [Selaginella moellendorffii]|eukprot:XP_024517182.1 serine/threonine-protein kinase chk1-like [Selaginella moellendorffii]